MGTGVVPGVLVGVISGETGRTAGAERVGVGGLGLVAVGCDKRVGSWPGAGVWVGASSNGATKAASASTGVDNCSAAWGVDVTVCTSKLAGRPAGMAVTAAPEMHASCKNTEPAKIGQCFLMKIGTRFLLFKT